MKIAFILTRMDEIGGAQIHVRDLCLYLSSLGHEPVVITGLTGRINDHLEHLGIKTIEIPDLYRSIHLVRDWRALEQIQAALSEIKPDLISTHSSKAGILGRLAAARLKVPTIFTAHGWSFTDGVPPLSAFFYRTIERLMGRFSKHIITVSQYDRNIALRAGVASPDGITAIHNGMAERPLAPRHFQSGHKASLCRMIMVARFSEQKDHATLLYALSDLVDLDWELTLAGGGDNTKAIDLVRELKLENRVMFLSERTDIAELLEEHDLFCLITNWEGFPRSILEAMRAGLPVLATDVGGVREAVDPKFTGFLVKRGDVAGVGEALKILITKPALRLQYGAAGRKRFEENFTFLRMATQTTAVYENILTASLVDKVDNHSAAA